MLSVSKARALLGDDANGMTDRQIEEVISTLDLLAKDALQKARRKLRMKKDASQLAELIYDIYQEKKSSGSE